MGKNKLRTVLIGFLVAGISILHYAVGLRYHHFHILFRELYFLPIILSGFWFGLRGAMLTSLCITGLFVPYTLITWQGFSPEDFGKGMEILVYNLAALMIGVLKDREMAVHRRLLENERLASMGRALAAVAHDLKTPLIAIGGYARLVQKKLGRNDSSYKKLDIVINETARLESMVKDMLDFSHPLNVERLKMDLNEITKESVAIVEEATKTRNVRVQTQLANGLSPVSVDAQRMKQALVNLLLNAIQASPDGEVITVRSRLDNGYVRIDVADNGCGITADQRDKIFAPFFTAKKRGGTGLGLPIVKKIVEAHEGHVEVSDGVEKGTTFTLLLPSDKDSSLSVTLPGCKQNGAIFN